ncbi:LicD family protein [Scandinavium manionii]|uniref:LicD family protein n=1 Tax=Scandinavium manionii TaxID=2926520 RepID=UPI00216574AD|nr:LicD family protein [Scandinavium manionii]MCS2168273.1 LicD family protein [Scandinavium manionii]
MKKSNLRDAQLLMVDILSEVDRICKKNGIDYWIDAGTLLGAIRHSGFIPWDDDIDICMKRDDYVKFLSVVNDELNKSDFFVQTSKTDSKYKNLNIPCKIRMNNTVIIETWEVEEGGYDKESHHGIFIDIFPYDKYSTNKFKRKYIQRILSQFFKIKTLQPREKKKSVVSFFCRYIGMIIPKRFIYLWLDVQSKRMMSKGRGYQYGAGIETPFFRAYFDEDEIFPTKDISFEGRVFKGPNKPYDYLTKMFGSEFMTLPPEENRIWHHTKIEINLNDI